jgi:broad specificity phosphatase PhoE
VPDTRFILIRHAESSWNACGRWQGHADPPLSGRGRAQAELLARELAGQPIDVLLASDLIRATQTAEIVGEMLGLKPVLDARLRELNVGDWAGLTRTEIARRDPETLARFEAGDPDVLAGGGESRGQIRARVRACARQLGREHAGRLVAVVSHLGVIWALQPESALGNAQWCQACASELALDGAPAARGAR